MALTRQKSKTVQTMKWSTQNKQNKALASSAENTKRNRVRLTLTIYEMTLFSMFGALMFMSKKLMEALPNMHLLGMLIVLLTVVYRFKALIPIYIYVFLDGVMAGFAPWWLPYLYVWAVLWAVAMLIPKNIQRKYAVFVYPLVCALHGLLFGTLYAPAQALLYSLNFSQMIAWIVAGFPYDVIHAVCNLFLGILVYPLAALLRKLESSVYSKVK